MMEGSDGLFFVNVNTFRQIVVGWQRSEELENLNQKNYSSSVQR